MGGGEGERWCRWGSIGSRIFPAALRECLDAADVESFAEALRLPRGTTALDRFDAPVQEPFDHNALNAAWGRVLVPSFLQYPAVGRGDLLAAVVGFDGPLELEWLLSRAPLRTRSRNIVNRILWQWRSDLRGKLSAMTVAELTRSGGAGVVSSFDTLWGIEVALLGPRPDHVGDVSDLDSEESQAFLREVTYNNRPALPGWASLVVGMDPRFEQYLGGSVDLTSFVGACPVQEFPALRNTLSELEVIVREASSATIEEEALSILRAILDKESDQRVIATASRFGLRGRVPTLEEAAAELGLTRERVRQIQARVAEKLPKQPLPLAPAIEQAVQVIEHSIPCSVTDLGDALRQAGLTKLRSWEVGALKAVASVSGRELSEVEQVGGLVGRARDLVALASWQASARAVSNFYGVGSIDHVVRRMREEHDWDPGHFDGSPRQLIEQPGLHWLDSQHFWTEHPTGRNRLVNTTRRMLAVHSPQSLIAAEEGIERHFAFRRASRGDRAAFLALVAPSRAVLRSFYRSHPAFVLLQDDEIRSSQPVGLDELGAETRYMVELLRQRPYCAMSRLDLLEACVAAGMNVSTVNVWLTYSECFQQHANNVWGIRGVDVPLEVVDEIREGAAERRLSTDKTTIGGKTASGKPWVARRLTASQVFSRVLPCDWARDELVGHTLSAIDVEDGEEVGELRFGGNFNWGYSRFLAKHRACEGQVIRLLANLDSGECYVEIGGDELLSEPFDF